jgi:hypothetical protein
MANLTIKLTTPIEGPATDGNPSGQIREIILREPKYADLMLLGEPAAYARSEGGLVYTADRDETIHAYIERLLEQPKDRALLAQVTLADAIQLREAVFGFFHIARKTIAKE